MHNSVHVNFIVNGSKCQLTTDHDGIKWLKSADKEAKRIDFNRIVGIKTKLNSPDRKLKVYYAKENSNKSSGRLLKVKKLIIEPTNKIAANCANNDIDSMTSSSSSSTTTTTTTTATVETTRDTKYLAFDRLVQRIKEILELERQQRPRRVLIYVNPFGGKGKALQLYKKQVRRLFDLAQVEVKLIITKHANHARDTIEDPMFNVEYFDGIVCVGGDGMFAELMNGLLFRYNREKILTAQYGGGGDNNDEHDLINSTGSNRRSAGDKNNDLMKNKREKQQDNNNTTTTTTTTNNSEKIKQLEQQENLKKLRSWIGGVGQQFVSPPIPVGVIGAGSTDANSFGIIGTNDVITATLNIILGNQINIDVCSIHSIQDDRLLRFVSTFVAYGYFGDVVRESEKFRWLGPTRYDLTGFNNLIKNRTYKGSLKILISNQDGNPRDFEEDRCHSNCAICAQAAHGRGGLKDEKLLENLELIEREGLFMGVNAAVTACRCPQTRKGFSPGNHLANGCADLILIRPCSRLQYLQYLLRTGFLRKSAFDLKYVEAFRCRQFEFVAAADDHVSQRSPHPAQPTSSSSSNSTNELTSSSSSTTSSADEMTEKGTDDQSSRGFKQSSNQLGDDLLMDKLSSWNVDGEILEEQSLRVKVNNQLLRVYGTGEPVPS